MTVPDGYIVKCTNVLWSDLAQFFGNKSPFDILVAVVALLTGAYTFYKSFLERAKLSLYPGDRLGLVVSTGGGSRKLHLRANLVNQAVIAIFK